MRVLADFGHTAIVVGNRVFEQNDIVHISTDERGNISILKENESIHAKYIRNLYDAKLYNLDEVGGKAMNLSLLKTKGYNVPHGVVLTTGFFDKVLESSQINLSDFLMNKGKVNITSALWDEILSSGLLDKSKKYSVRSSATVEDQAEHSFAGQFNTNLNVDFKDLKKNVINVIESAANESVVGYFKALNKEPNLKMAVVIQEMVKSDIAGVTFGKDIQTMNSDNIIIDMAKGLGEGVVDGTAASARAIYSRIDGEIVKYPDANIVGVSKPVLNALVEMALSVERLMGSIQDIEWAIDELGTIWVLQSRNV
jgi:pyruvate,water dikinase